MEIKKITTSTICEEITMVIQEQKECILYWLPEKNYVLVGRHEDIDYNKEYCEKNDIGMLRFPNEGGIIVSSDGDFDIGYFSKDTTNKFNENFAQQLLEYLKNKGLSAEFSGNDLIIDNVYKCGSYSSRRFENILFSAFHISVGCNLELIKHICKKEMIKIPKALSDYGITTQEIGELFLKYVS